MKRIIALALALMMLCFALVSCGGKTAYTFASGGTGGTYYGVATALAGVYDDVTDLRINVDVTGASKANIQLVQKGEADFAIVQNDVMQYAYTGTDLFAADGKVTNFRTVAAVYAEVCQIIGDPAITSVADLKGKVVSIGAAGSGVEFNALQILNAYGLTKDDITVVNADFNDSVSKYKDGQIDAFFITAGAPTTAVSDLAANRELNLINIPEDYANKLIEMYPYYSRYEIPAGTYGSKQTESAWTVAVKATIICSDSLSEDVVYQFTKALFENKDALVLAHAKFENVDLDYAQNGIGDTPFHAGAAKYYSEVK